MIGSTDDLLDVCGDFFDQIDDLLDFSTEDIVAGAGENYITSWTTAPPDTMIGAPDSVFSGYSDRSSSELATELSVPYEDIAQLEWLSNFVEDSFSAGSGVTLDKDSFNDHKNNDSHRFQSSSPVSVLESSSSCSGGGRTMPLSPETVVPGRARSKRPRPATFNPRPVIPLISPTSSITEPNQPLSASKLENYAESRPTKPTKNVRGEEAMEQKKKKKLSLIAGSAEQSVSQPIAIRKCMHCEITKTPQWRAGPMGPKTLCNACGVRYKSGRLFPEYRPAASPTFISSLHSNSHKKVLEMRSKVSHYAEMSAAATPITDATELMPRSIHMLDYI